MAGTLRRRVRVVTSSVAARTRAEGDAGFSLAEMLVALVLVTVSVTAMLGMITRSLQTHRAQRDSAAAERLATTEIETARNESFTSLATGPRTSTDTQNGQTATTTITPCSSTDAPTQCTTPSSAASTDLRVRTDVTWTEAGGPKHLTLTTGVTDPGSTAVTGGGSTTIGGLTGGAVNGASISLSSLAVSPTAATVGADGHPQQSVTVSLTVTSLASSTTFPLTWSDDTGGHQATLSMTSYNTWGATIPASSITRVLASGQSGAVVFAATVPGSRAVPTTTLTLTPPAPPTLSCTSPVAIVLTPLTAKTATTATLSCVSTALVSTDAVTVAWPTATGTTTGRLASPDGTNWSLVLPAGTVLKSGLTEAFAYSATRAADHATAAATSTSALA